VDLGTVANKKKREKSKTFIQCAFYVKDKNTYLKTNSLLFTW